MTEAHLTLTGLRLSASSLAMHQKQRVHPCRGKITSSRGSKNFYNFSYKISDTNEGIEKSPNIGKLYTILLNNIGFRKS